MRTWDGYLTLWHFHYSVAVPVSERAEPPDLNLIDFWLISCPEVSIDGISRGIPSPKDCQSLNLIPERIQENLRNYVWNSQMGLIVINCFLSFLKAFLLSFLGLLPPLPLRSDLYHFILWLSHQHLAKHKDTDSDGWKTRQREREREEPSAELTILSNVPPTPLFFTV